MTMREQFNNDKPENAGPYPFRARMHSIECRPQDAVWIMELTPDQPFPYKAGQSVALQFANLPGQTYPLANAPGGNGNLVVHIPMGPGAAGWHISQDLHLHEPVKLSPPVGASVYDPEDQRPIIAIAGQGTHMASLKAIVDEALRSHHPAPVYFLWETMAAQEQYYAPYFERLSAQNPQLTFFPVSGPERAADYFADFSGYRIHIAGPPGMVQRTAAMLRQKGATDDSLFFDLPDTLEPPRAAAAQLAGISAMKDGPLDHLIKALAGLPGLGPRSAQRAALFLLTHREKTMTPLIRALEQTEKTIRTCGTCGNLDLTDPCRICADARRDSGTICIVGGVAALWAVERTGTYRGQYHALGGLLSALDGIGPDQLRIAPLLQRVQSPVVKEIILALSATVDGQATAHYLTDRLHDVRPDLRITRLAHGMPVGGELDYLDDGTIATALKSRAAL